MNKKNETTIPALLWNAFDEVFKENKTIEYICWKPSKSNTEKVTVFHRKEPQEGLGITTTPEIKLPKNKTVLNWESVALKPHHKKEPFNLPINPVAVSAIQPGDTAAGATLSVFLKKKIEGKEQVVFATANHAEDVMNVIHAGSAGKKATIIDRDPMLDILIAQFDSSVQIDVTVKKANLRPKRTIPTWRKNQRFCVVGARSPKIAFARSYQDYLVLSRDEYMHATEIKGGIMVKLNKFVLVLEEENTVNDGDSGGLVLFANPDKDECEDAVAGILIEISTKNAQYVIATKISSIENRFDVRLYTP